MRQVHMHEPKGRDGLHFRSAISMYDAHMADDLGNDLCILAGFSFFRRGFGIVEGAALHWPPTADV